MQLPVFRVAYYEIAMDSYLALYLEGNLGSLLLTNFSRGYTNS